MDGDKKDRLLAGLNAEKICVAIDEVFLKLQSLGARFDASPIVEAAILAMDTLDNPSVIAERVLKFGPLVVDPALRLLKSTRSHEVAVLASLILVNNGSQAGLSVLLDEINQCGEYDVTAALALANAGISDHFNLMIERLCRFVIPTGRDYPSDDDDAILGFIEAIEVLRIPLPEYVRRKFLEDAVPRYFRDAVSRCERISG